MKRYQTRGIYRCFNLAKRYTELGSIDEKFDHARSSTARTALSSRLWAVPFRESENRRGLHRRIAGATLVTIRPTLQLSSSLREPLWTGKIQIGLRQNVLIELSTGLSELNMGLSISGVSLGESGMGLGKSGVGLGKSSVQLRKWVGIGS